MSRRLISWLVMGALLGFGYHELTAPSNWYECVLDRMPGAQNDYAAAAIAAGCSRDFGDPLALTHPYHKNGRYGSGNLCVTEKDMSTNSLIGAQLIVGSCHALYDPPGQTPN